MKSNNYGALFRQKCLGKHCHLLEEIRSRSILSRSALFIPISWIVIGHNPTSQKAMPKFKNAINTIAMAKMFKLILDTLYKNSIFFALFSPEDY